MTIDELRKHVSKMQDELEVLETARANDPVVTIISLLERILSKLDKIHTIAYNDHNDIGPGRLGGGVL
jgi:hypothetical protein